ncbi:MAG: TonB-dependent receptor, partial [Melioribacteraceae bacterium]
MNKKYKNIFCIILFAVFQNFLFAQSGDLSGYIFDKDNNPLNGANVIIAGTNFGAASNSEGYFEIRNIPFGNYNLEISVIGFRKEKIINVLLNENFKPLKITLQQEIIETGQVIVSAGKYEQKITDITVSSAVIGPEIISKKNFTALDEVLRYVPGVSVALEQVSIRGSSGYSKGAGTRVLVAVDGIPIYTGETGEIVWELIPLTDIERIEIIKGPASSLYGSTAIGGVINIISKKAAQEPVTYLKTFAGFYGDPSYDEWKWNKSQRTFYGLEAVHSNRNGDLGYTFSINKNDNDSYRENDFNKRVSGYLKLDYDFDSEKSLTLIGNFLEMNRGNFLYWKDSRNALVPKDGDRDQTVKSSRQFVS